MPLPPKKSVDYFDLKSLSFKFGNDTCIALEIPRPGSLQKALLENLHFVAIPSIYNQHVGPKISEKIEIYSLKYQRALSSLERPDIVL